MIARNTVIKLTAAALGLTGLAQAGWAQDSDRIADRFDAHGDRIDRRRNRT